MAANVDATAQPAQRGPMSEAVHRGDSSKDAADEEAKPSTSLAPDDSAAVATTASAGPRETRKGERFLDPKKVALYTKDFTLETVISKAPPPAPADISAEEAAKVAARQAASWEGHYRTNKGLYPVKNYVAQAFPSVFLAWEAYDAAAADNKGESTRDVAGGDRVARCVLECGCGVGSALLPLAALLPLDRFVGFDISQSAITTMNAHERVLASKGRITGFVHDIATRELPQELDGAADAILLVFVLSAVGRSHQCAALSRLRRCMRDANSRLCFRDYARYDHNERRFFDNKNPVKDGGYTKGDGTLQCFFELEETRALFAAAGFVEVVPLEYHFNRVHNRKTDVEMRKVFINGVFGIRER